MMTWSDDPGDRPFVLVGAGFPLALLEPTTPPSTATLLKETAEKHAEIFPAVNALVNAPLFQSTNLIPNLNLNFVWSNLRDFSLSLLPHYERICKQYAESSAGSNFSSLVQYLLNKYSPTDFLWVVLGVELKRAIALHYDSASIKVKCDKKCAKLNDFLSRTRDKHVTWMSLNYDLLLEGVLKKAKIRWKYCFANWLLPLPPKNDASHIIVKPHGSVNVIFETIWDRPPLHSLSFRDETDMMVSFEHGNVGCDQFHESQPTRERRPWLVGYLPDAMKDELNSPVGEADAAHDLCKGNVAYASLRLLQATSIYVLGYSMPLEDQWIWGRLRALQNKALGIYIATWQDSEAVKQRFVALGFQNAQILPPDGDICSQEK